MMARINEGRRAMTYPPCGGPTPKTWRHSSAQLKKFRERGMMNAPRPVSIRRLSFPFRRPSLALMRGCLPLLQVLLLRRVSLLQLLRLLLMPLFYLLCFRLAVFLLRQTLMVLLLPLLQFLPFFILLRVQLLLLLLIFLVGLRDAGIGGRAALGGRKIFGVHSIRRARSVLRTSGGFVGARLISHTVGSGAIGGWMIRGSRLFGGHRSIVKGARPFGGRDGRAALIGGCTQLRIASSRLHVLTLGADRA